MRKIQRCRCAQVEMRPLSPGFPNTARPALMLITRAYYVLEYVLARGFSLPCLDDPPVLFTYVRAWIARAARAGYKRGMARCCMLAPGHSDPLLGLLGVVHSFRLWTPLSLGGKEMVGAIEALRDRLSGCVRSKTQQVGRKHSAGVGDRACRGAEQGGNTDLLPYCTQGAADGQSKFMPRLKLNLVSAHQCS